MPGYLSLSIDYSLGINQLFYWKIADIDDNQFCQFIDDIGPKAPCPKVLCPLSRDQGPGTRDFWTNNKTG